MHMSNSRRFAVYQNDLLEQQGYIPLFSGATLVRFDAAGYRLKWRGRSEFVRSEAVCAM